MNDFKAAFAALLAHAKAKGITQDALAERAGIHRNTMLRARHRAASLGWPTWVRLCDAAGAVGSFRSQLLVAYIEAKCAADPETAAVLRVVREVVARSPHIDPAEVQQVLIDAWAATQAEHERTQAKKRL